jgi:hypothetical protein
MSDPNDTLRSEGTEAVRSEFDNIFAIGSALKSVIFHGSVPIAPPPMLIDGLLPTVGLAFVGGQSGAGKTFIVVDLAVASATGGDFFGRPVEKRCGVFIIAAEGRAMLAARIEAAARHRTSTDRELPIAYAAEVPELKTDADIKKFGALLKSVGHVFEKKHKCHLGAVIIDTVVAAFDLDDEDHNSEAARVIRRMRSLGDTCGALIVPVHHYGKTISTGLRGGSSWRAGADVIISVLADRDDVSGDVKNRRLALAKARDGIEGPIAPFDLEWVALDVEHAGKPFGTCIIKPMLDKPVLADRAVTAATVGRRDRMFREAFAEALLAFGVERIVMGDGPKLRAVRMDDVRAEFRRRYATGEDEAKGRSDALRKAFKRALDSLAAEFSTEVHEDVEWIWSK